MHIVVYRLHSFIRQHKSPSPAYKMEYIGDNQIFYDAAYNTDPRLSDGNALYSFFISDVDRVVAKYFPYDENIRSAVRFYNKMLQFYKYKGNILFTPLLINDVYVFESGKVHCRYHIDYGSLNIPDELLNADNLTAFIAKKNEYALLCEAIETDAFVILYSELENNPIISVYSKKTTETMSFNYEDMRNDIDGMPLNPFTATDQVGNLISVVYPASVIDFSEGSEFQTVREYARKLDEFGNPIIAICYPKAFDTL